MRHDASLFQGAQLLGCCQDLLDISTLYRVIIDDVLVAEVQVVHDERHNGPPVWVQPQRHACHGHALSQLVDFTGTQLVQRIASLLLPLSGDLGDDDGEAELRRRYCGDLGAASLARFIN